ncbi:MAG: hypothetical protein AAF171_21885 [Cyanobacteria bacterium P01_A01_bin.116]
MTPAKPNWQKVIYWFSPVLGLSIALHGLALLIPVPPEKEPIEETQVELPEPIQVSELPKRPKPTAPEPTEPIVVPPPAPVVEPPLPAAPDPVPESIPELVIVPEPDTIEQPLPELQPQDFEAFEPLEPDPQTPDTQTPDSQDPDTLPQEQPTRQAFNSDLANAPSIGAGSPLDVLRTGYQDESGELPQKNIRKKLALKFPKANTCFEGLEVPQELRLSSGIVLEKLEDAQGQSLIEIVDGSLLQATGYQGLNSWTDQSILPPSPGDEAASTDDTPDDSELPPLADVDILSWIEENVGEDLFETEETIKLFTFPVQVTVVDNSACGS